MYESLSAHGQVPQLLPAALPNMVLLASQPASQLQLWQEPGGMVPTTAWILFLQAWLPGPLMPMGLMCSPARAGLVLITRA